jgi:DNA mismatch endonuclease (patch repair protein)
MSDVFSKQKRSEVMSLIKGKGNRSTELRLIEILKGHRITGWRRNYSLLGKPDFVFSKQKIAIFVDGCFWHSCPRCSSRPKQNREFWLRKLGKTRKRDAEITKILKGMGWQVLRFWEHELSDADLTAAKISMLINGKSHKRGTNEGR